MKYFLTALIVSLFIVGCAGPRSANYCISNGDYVKCPKGYVPGDIIK